MRIATRLDRLQRQLDALHHDAADNPPAPIPARYYELDANGRRVYVEADAADRAIEEKFRRLVHGPRGAE